MRTYDTYKDSGIKWFGQIPVHWGVEPFGRHFRYGKGLPITKANLMSEGVAVISYGQIHSKLNTGTKMTDNLIRFVSPSYLVSNPQSLLCKNDFVFADTSEDVEGSGNCAFNDFNGDIFAGYHTVIARPVDLQLPRYYAYLFQSRSWKNQVQSLVNGVKVYSINKSILKKSSLLFPPIAEQEGIVAFLDEKTAAIDDLVEQVEREIELLKEFKQAEIARVVTKGLNPNAPIKPSGIAWIGDIPQHWSIEKVGQNFSERREKVSDKDYPALSVSKEGVTPQLETAVKTNNGDNRKKVCKGDFVVNSRSDRKGSCGFSNFDGSVSLINTVLIPRNNVNGRYYHYVFRSNDFIEEFYRLGRGIVADLWTTRFTEQRNIMIPVPPIEEQQEIVDYIDRKTTEIDRLVVELTYQVEYLKEYKQRLIADVVTGKINVQPE